MTDTRVIERRLVGLPVDEGDVQPLPLDVVDLRVGLLERLDVLLTQQLVEVELAGAQTRQLCGGIGDGQSVDLVDMWLTLAVIVRVLLASDGDARFKLVEDERSATNNTLGSVAVGLDHLARHDPENWRADGRLEGHVDVIQAELDRPGIWRCYVGY